MTCPVCGGETKVIDSRANTDHVIRRRRCKACDYCFYTIETELDIYENLGKGKKSENERNDNY